MKDGYISLNKSDKVFFVAEFDYHTDEYVRLTYNLTYEDCKSYVGNKKNLLISSYMQRLISNKH